MVDEPFEIHWVSPPDAEKCAWDGNHEATMSTAGGMLKVTSCPRSTVAIYGDRYFHDFRCLWRYAEDCLLEQRKAAPKGTDELFRPHYEVIAVAKTRLEEEPARRFHNAAVSGEFRSDEPQG